MLAGAGRSHLADPETGLPKAFCALCGGHVWSRRAGRRRESACASGALHGDPGIAPQWRQWLSSAQDWAPIPDDGVPRFDGPREIVCY